MFLHVLTILVGDRDLSIFIVALQTVTSAILQSLFASPLNLIVGEVALVLADVRLLVIIVFSSLPLFAHNIVVTCLKAAWETDAVIFLWLGLS